MFNGRNTAEELYLIDEDDYADLLDREVPEANASSAEEGGDTAAVTESIYVDKFEDLEVMNIDDVEDTVSELLAVDTERYTYASIKLCYIRINSWIC